MSLHAIEIAAAVAVAMIFRRFCGVPCCYVEPLAAHAARLKMQVKPALQLFRVVAPNPSEDMELARVAYL
jgi:hypothetical protein